MTGSERRQELLQLLIRDTDTNFPAPHWQKHFTVSRQVIVQDMALLRAQGHEVLSTNRGYLIQAPLRVLPVVFKAFFTPVNRLSMSYALLWISAAPLKMSLFIIKVYGQLQAPLHISSRRDVQLFLEELKRRQIHATERCHFRLPLSYRLRGLRRNSGSDRTGVRKERISLPVTFWR